MKTIVRVLGGVGFGIFLALMVLIAFWGLAWIVHFLPWPKAVA